MALLRLCRLGLALLLGVSLFAPAGSAHDIPNQIRLQGFVKPEGNTLHFLVRVPLVMLLNLDLPKRGPGFLALGNLDDALGRAAAATAREIVLYEDGEPLTYGAATTRISQLSDQSFGSFEEALAHVEGPPLPPDADVFWNQGYFDAHFVYPIRSPDGDFALDPQVAPGLRNILTLIVRFLPPGAAERAYELHYGSGRVHLDPSWYAAAWTFVQLGFHHILDGIDHLLFLFCLVLPFRMREFWKLAAVITSFTVAHSITLIASASGVTPAGDWFPPLVEVVIAASILYMALENILLVWFGGGSLANLRWRWLIAGAFGLIHGFGFSFVLQNDLQLAGSHFLLSLLSFNVGVELGQLAVLLVAMPVLALLLNGSKARAAGVVILSALVAHTAWHWMLDRLEALRFVQWPEVDAVAVAWLLLGLVLIGAIGSAIWLSRRPQPGARATSPPRHAGKA